jgi:GT2 family glycosyltransferase
LLRAPDACACGGVLTFAHRPDLVASAGIEVARDLVHRDARALTSVAALPEESSEIFGASGGAVCLRRAALEDVGLFEERFGSYLEDADLAWRLRLRGWRSLSAPVARLPHIYSATAGHFSAEKQRLLALNRWRTVIRCIPAALLVRCAAAVARYEIMALFYGAATRNRPIIEGRLQALREFSRLHRERRAIQRRATVDSPQLERWLIPAPTARQSLEARGKLKRLLRDRPVETTSAGG